MIAAMQWAKVKNVLIVILLAVNAFLLGNLALKYHTAARAADALLGDVRVLLSSQGMTLADDFSLPPDKTLPQLSLDRSRTDEQAVSAAMLGETAVRQEDEDGLARYQSEQGELNWNADGTVSGWCLTEYAGDDEAAAKRQARTLLGAWGLWVDGAALAADGSTVTLTAPVAGMAVHNRALTLEFEQNRVQLRGIWSFGQAYANARESGVTCAAADALIAFAGEAEEVTQVWSMELGYRLQEDGGRHLRLVPTWKIQTDNGAYLVDCAKKAVI